MKWKWKFLLHKIKKYSIDVQQLIFLIEKLTYFVFLKKN